MMIEEDKEETTTEDLEATLKMEYPIEEDTPSKSILPDKDQKGLQDEKTETAE